MSRRGVLRGMHFQMKHPQGKIVRVLQGRVYDVVVDIRKESQSYGQSFGVELTDSNHRQVYIPPGFAHGFLTLSDTAVIAYKARITIIRRMRAVSCGMILLSALYGRNSLQTA